MTSGSIWLVFAIWVTGTWALSPLVRNRSFLGRSVGIAGISLLAPVARSAISYLHHREPWYKWGTLRFASFEVVLVAILIGMAGLFWAVAALQRELDERTA